MVIDFEGLYYGTNSATDLDDALRAGAEGSARGMAFHPNLLFGNSTSPGSDPQLDPAAIVRSAQKCPGRVWRVIVIGSSGFEALDIQGADNKDGLDLMRLLYANVCRSPDHININLVAFAIENTTLFLASSTMHTRALTNVVDGINRVYGPGTIDVAADIHTIYYHKLQTALEKAHGWQCDVVMANSLAKDIARSMHLMQDMDIHLNCHHGDDVPAVGFVDGFTSDAIISTNICDSSFGGNDSSVFDRVVQASIESSDGLQEPLRTLVRGRIEKVQNTYRTPREIGNFAVM